MTPVLTLVRENLARLEADKALIATELSAKELEYQKSIEPLAEDLKAVEANIAQYEAMRSRFIADVHKAIRLKLIAIICDKFTPELLAKSDERKALVITVSHTIALDISSELFILYSRSSETFIVRLKHNNFIEDIYFFYTRHKEVNEFEFSQYIREHLRKLNSHTEDRLPTGYDSLITLCSLLGIEC